MPHVVRTRVRAFQTPPAPATAPPRTVRARSLVDAEAIAVLHRAAWVLLDDLAGLTDRLVAALREQEPAYRSAIEADASEVWQEVHRSLRHSIGSLIQPGKFRDAACRTSWRIGASRAEQGLPLDALLHAFRLGGAMVWQGLVDETARRRPDDIRLLVHVAAEVWNFVDEHCGLVTDAYRQAERRLAWSRDNRLRLITAALLDGTVRTGDLPDAAAALNVPELGRYTVVAVGGAARPGPDPRGAPARWTPPPGMRAVRHPSEDREHVIVLLADGQRYTGAQEAEGAGESFAGAPRAAEPAALAAGLGLPPGTRAGVSPAVVGLGSLGDARRLADTALLTCPRDGGVVLLEEHLPAALVVSSPGLGAALAERVFGPLRRLEPADRDVLIDTLTVWLESDGSAQRAGARLYCHRNTVLNRLRRFEQLTGRCLNRPSDAVEISLALAARRLFTISSG